jgi:3-hydroxyisobutyrate dehydrogenase-like beta-hydroxyacid dehydrogenase
MILNDSSQSIGIIGVGLLGTAIGLRLLDHGYKVRIWNRNRHEAEELLARGALWSDNPLAECSRVIICLYNSEVVREVVERLQEGIHQRQIVVDMTTGMPDDAERMAESFACRGARYLEAPVSGSSEQARHGQVMIMVSGNETAFDACADLWQVLTNMVHYLGPSGTAARMKLVTNLVLGINRAALAEGLAFAKMIGVDPKSALDVLKSSAAASRVMESKGEKMLLQDFRVQAKLSQHLKDVDIILKLAAEQNRELPLSQTHQRLLKSAVRQGYGETDNSAIIQAYSNQAMKTDDDRQS